MLYSQIRMPTVFVIARDWMLRAGVRAELHERGVEALGMESVEEAGRAIAGGTMPSAVVLDADDAQGSGAAVEAIAQRVPTLVISSRVAQAAAPPHAAAVLPRPITVGEIVVRVLKLLEGTPA